MASWGEIEAQFPEFAARVRAAFDVHKHKTLATLRRDGSPRISGIEANFRDGVLWLGMMPDSMKVFDLRRDPRFALHSATVDAELTLGDAKLAGRAIEVTDPEIKRAWLPDQFAPDEAVVFTADIAEVTLTSIGDPADHLQIDTWNAFRGFISIARY